MSGPMGRICVQIITFSSNSTGTPHLDTKKYLCTVSDHHHHVDQLSPKLIRDKFMQEAGVFSNADNLIRWLKYRAQMPPRVDIGSLA